MNNSIKQLIHQNVATAIFECLVDDGLHSTINQLFDNLEYNLPEIFVPTMSDQDDDAEWDRLHAKCKNIALIEFKRIMKQISKASAIIDKALTYP